MVIKELLDLKNMIKAQIFSIYKLIKIVIIYENKNVLFAAF